MKLNQLIFTVIFMLSLLLSGCNVAALLGEEERHPREPLNIADWPTPVLTATPAPPTPFPKGQLPATPAITESSGQSAETDNQTADISSNTIPGSDLSGLVAQVTALTGGLAPAGFGLVNEETTTLQQLPDNSANTVSNLSQGDTVGVLGQDASADWVYVITPDLQQGWVAADEISLTLVGGELPTLPDDRTPGAESTASTDSSMNRLVGDSSDASVASVLKGGLSPVAVFNVQVEESALRQGPGSNFASNGGVSQGDLGAILGTDAGQNWLYVITIDKLQGWLPVDAARILGTLENAPVLPANPLAAFQQNALAAATGNTSSNTNSSGSLMNRPGSIEAASTSSTALDISDLEPVATARISSDLLNLRQRPGGNYPQLGTVRGDTEVQVYGLNRAADWALIADATGKAGWVSLDFLNVAGSLANAPQFHTLEPTASNQIAPFVDAADASVAVITAASSGGNTRGGTVAGTNGSVAPQPEPPSAVVSPKSASNLPSNTLAPQTSARVNKKVDIRRGPGLEFGGLHELTVDENVTVLAANPAKDWLVVRTPDSKIGWAPRNTLDIAGSLDQAQAVVTGLVQSNEVPVRRGPGIYYETIGNLSINELVSVLALDNDKSWALVETLAATPGWVPSRLLSIAGSLAGLPTAEAPPLTISPAPETLPPSPTGLPSGKLVVQSTSGGDIYTLNVDGSGLRYLTTGIDPVLSPDGSQIAFTRWQGDIGTLWIMNLDGSGERAILGEMTKAKGPDWSPDGSQIVLNFQQGGRVQASRACRDFATKPPPNAINVRLDFTPEGEPKICWTDPPDPHWTIRTVNIADGSYEDRDGGLYAFRPAWDPAQPWRIVSDSGSGLVAFDINREEYRQPLSDLAGDGSPAISPDGRFMALATQLNNSYEIFRTNADGSGRVRLTETPLWETVQPGVEPRLWNNVAPVWSPDGSQVAFLTDRSGPWEIWVMNADGSNPRPLLPPEIQQQLNLDYNFVDERTISWR